MRDTDSRAMRGMQTVAEALRGEDYPLDLEEINYSVGDIEVENGRGGWVAVRDLTEQFKREQFNSAEDVMREIRRSIQDSKAA